MKFKKYNKFRYRIRNKILLPIANRLIDIRPRSIRIVRDGVQYEARYHRARFWYDGTPITIKRILEKREIYHVDYWDGGKNGNVWCEMFGWGPKIIHVKRRKYVKSTVTEYLNNVIDMWLKHIVKPSKEKESKKPDFTNHTGDDYEN